MTGTAQGDGNDFDVVVVGGGPAGYATALHAAAAGMSVALVEKAKVGGTCLHAGCIPAKELLQTAEVHRAVSGAGEFGIKSAAPTLDFSVSQARKQQVVDRLFSGLSGLLARREVTVLAGAGTLHAGHVVTVEGGESGDLEVSGTHVVLATGSVPRTIPGFEVCAPVVVTSDELLSITELPATAAVIGGGAIGCEFASMMADLGTKVTVLEAMSKILPGVDDDVAAEVGRSFRKRGIKVTAGVAVSGHTPGPAGTTVHYGDGESVEVGMVVVSVGRRPLTDGVLSTSRGPVAVEVTERGFIAVDELCRTGEPGVYAVGDVIGTPQLAHVGFAEGMMVIEHLLGRDPLPIDYSRVPWCIYCRPEVAFAGHSEQSATEAGHEVVVSKHRFMGNGRALILGETEGLVKVVAQRRPDGSAGQILGVHMAGPWVTEQLGQGYLAVNWEATAAEVAQFIQPHPTLSEAFGEAVMSLAGRGLHG